MHALLGPPPCRITADRKSQTSERTIWLGGSRDRLKFIRGYRLIPFELRSRARTAACHSFRHSKPAAGATLEHPAQRVKPFRGAPEVSCVGGRWSKRCPRDHAELGLAQCTPELTQILHGTGHGATFSYCQSCALVQREPSPCSGRWEARPTGTTIFRDDSRQRCALRQFHLRGTTRDRRCRVPMRGRLAMTAVGGQRRLQAA